MKRRLSAASKLCVTALYAGPLLLLASCSAKNEPVVESRSGNFRVSVATDGKPLQDFSQPLVHRIEMSPAELQRVFVPQAKKINLPFTPKKVYDSRGRVRGLKVTQLRKAPGVQSLGLQENDVVTAIGKSRPSGAESFWELYRELGQSKQSSLTLERGGKSHKILYFTGKVG